MALSNNLTLNGITPVGLSVRAPNPTFVLVDDTGALYNARTANTISTSGLSAFLFGTSSALLKNTQGYIVDQNGANVFGDLALRDTKTTDTLESQISIVESGSNATDGSQEPKTKFLFRTQSTSLATTRSSVFFSNLQPTTSTNTAYESIGLFVINATDDSSASANKDCVGIDTRGYIRPGNTLGRAWGLYAEGRTQTAAADGLIQAAEFSVVNTSSDQASAGSTTSKYGIRIVSAGTVNSTAAIFVNNNTGGPLFHKCLFMINDDLVTIANDANASFLELRSPALSKLFVVQSDGQIVSTALKDAANDAAAAAAGVPLNGFYFDSTAANVLKTRRV